MFNWCDKKALLVLLGVVDSSIQLGLSYGRFCWSEKHHILSLVLDERGTLTKHRSLKDYTLIEHDYFLREIAFNRCDKIAWLVTLGVVDSSNRLSLKYWRLCWSDKHHIFFLVLNKRRTRMIQRQYKYDTWIECDGMNIRDDSKVLAIFIERKKFKFNCFGP